MERFADSETGTGFSVKREAVRDPLGSFALLIVVGLTERRLDIERIS